MGKSKRKKTSSSETTANPTGLPSLKQAMLEAESNGYDIEDFVASNIDKLCSVMAEDRESACVALANSCASANVALLSKNVVRQLGTLLLDQSVAVARSASGLLRNMSIDGGYNACDIMIGHDLMTPLLALLKKFASGMWKISKPVDVSNDAYTETFVNVILLVQNLCESSNIALKVASLECVADFLVQCLDPVVYGGAVAVSTAECLLVLTEDNPALRACLQASGPISCIVESLTSGIKLLESVLADKAISAAANEVFHAVVAIAGTVVNLSDSNVSSLGPGTAQQILTILLKILEIDSIPCLQQLYEVASSGEACSSDEKELQPLDSALRAQESSVDHLLVSQKLALEILTDVLGSDDSANAEPDEWEDVESTGSDDGDHALSDDNGLMSEYEVCSAHATEGHLAGAGCMPSELLAFFIQNGLLHKVTARIKVLPDDLHTQFLECETLDGAQIVKRYDATVCAALLCLHNAMLATTAAADHAWNDAQAVCDIWTELSHLSTMPYVLTNSGLIECVTTALGSVAERMVEGSARNKLLTVTDRDLSVLGALASQNTQPQVRANAIHVLSIIGQKLAVESMSGTSLPSCALLMSIGNLLLQVASNDSELWVVAEALDAILDVFAEDHLDSILQEMHLIDVLQHMAPILKVKIKQNRKHLTEHLPIINTVQNNLGRFISYKRKRGV